MVEQPGQVKIDDPTIVARYVVRARRRADLSQRELAARLGMSQTAVCRLESADAGLDVARFAQILAMGGLRLVVEDDNGEAVTPVAEDTLRDNQGRRFPAHLDVGPPDVLTREQISSPRYDRPALKGNYHLRGQRDRIRSGAPRTRSEAIAIGLPDETSDHPTVSGLDERRRLMRGRQPRVDPPPPPWIECHCPLACYEGACLDQCPCLCEPRQVGAQRTDVS